MEVWMNFFVNFYIVTSHLPEEKKRLIILGQIAGLNAQLAFVQSGHPLLESSLVPTLRSNSGRDISDILHDHGSDWEMNLNARMFPGWTECSRSNDSGIYFANIGAASIAVSSIYQNLTNNTKLSSEKILLVVEEIVEIYIDFLNSELEM